MKLRQIIPALTAVFALSAASGVLVAQSTVPFAWQSATPESQGMSSERLEAFQQDLARRDTKDLLVIRNDLIVLEWYADGRTAADQHFTASMAKAIVGGMSLAVAINDGLISLDDPAWKYVPAWKHDREQSKITVRHLGSHTSGIEDSHNWEERKQGIDQGDYTGWTGEFWRWRKGQQRPPKDAFTISRDVAPMLFEPGTDFHYSNPGLAMLAWCVTASLKGEKDNDIRTLLRERIMRPIGAGDDEWSCGYGMTEEVDGLPLVANWGGGGYTPRTVARIGRLVLREGDWDGQQLVSAAAIHQVTHDAGLPGHCGMGWWTNGGDQYPDLPADAVWGAGAQDQILFVVPSLNLIMVRNGGSLTGKSDRDSRVEILFDPLIAAVTDGAPPSQQVLWPSPEWPSAAPEEVGLDASKLEQAERYALSAGGSGMIVRHGKVVRRWGDQAARYDIKSATKSFGATALGIALKDGKIELGAPARQYHPTLGTPPDSNAQTGWLDKITIQHLATQTAGFDKRGGYEPLLFEPGTHWRYSDGGPNWLAECITLQYRRDLEELMFERVFTPLGITRDDLQWRKNSYRPAEIEGIPRREFGAGIHANVEALSRIGYLYLHGGKWKDEQILSEEFVRLATRPIESVVGLPEWDSDTHGNASDHYGLLWWNNADGTLEHVPTSAFWAWGLYDSLIIVIPDDDLVVVRGGERGKSWPRDDDPARHYRVLEPFLEPIVAAVQSGQKLGSGGRLIGEEGQARTLGPAPYPPSEVITGIEWAPIDTIIRRAEGSDNWPMTWADDDDQYTSYGDGWGFEPLLKTKLSLGLVKIVGPPDDFQGINIRSPSAEVRGDGARGRKASGMLCIEGVLYMLARNADNSQLAWSDDHGKSWTWADWKWTTSFGCPTFLNFGKNYAGARDKYVYVYSFDSDSAYVAGDRYVMARVPQDRLKEQGAYEYFAGSDDQGQPKWSTKIDEREGVFSHPGRCYRSGITYNAPLKRYLWCQVVPESTHKQGQRFQGGFGVYEAPEPWGPWKTVFFTNAWYVGPGETNSFPTKWMSDDGKTLHLVFSGDDYFSVRQARLKTAD